MGLEEHKPEKLNRIPEQKGEVLREDKAVDMAYAEKDRREDALAFAKYVKDPRAFQMSRAQQRNVTPGQAQWEADRFKALKEAGVTPAYLHKMADIDADKEGEKFDYKEELGRKASPEVRSEIAT